MPIFMRQSIGALCRRDFYENRGEAGLRLAWDTFPVRAIAFGPLFIIIDSYRFTIVHIYILLTRPIKLKDKTRK